jgi:hypothetical protein
VERAKRSLSLLALLGLFKLIQAWITLSFIPKRWLAVCTRVWKCREPRRDVKVGWCFTKLSKTRGWYPLFGDWKMRNRSCKRDFFHIFHIPHHITKCT